MIKRIFKYSFLVAISCLLFFSCQSKQVISVNGVTVINSKAAQEKPYLILISLDGFRWDYVDRFKPLYLSSFIANGVKAASIIPSFPSKTFPNHYTIATGMYPDKNGIVGNSFYSSDKKEVYSIGNRKLVQEGRFYKGTPIWIAANNAQMVTASYFFVGTEANIQGIKPTYYKDYDGGVKNETRVNQAIDWLQLPAEKRPHLITMYFSDMDDAGHDNGPNNDEKLKQKLFALDVNLGSLFDKVKKTGLPVNIIIVSDHGMAEVKASNYISVDQLKDDTRYLTVDNGAIVYIYPKDDSDEETIYQDLKKKENHFKVYKTADTPGFEYTPTNKDWGTIQVVPDVGYYFARDKKIAAISKYPDKVFGVHGYLPSFKDMHGIFYANGPAFKKGYEIPSVKNIHVYPLMSKILSLEVPATVDGRLDSIKNVLKEN
ncbi:Alkaline phosphatase PhoV [Polaribacter huanghezhanensis]|uniref:alkaline phosphatase family protein n=1 Tax=Polaribacter huanghezhanensis TaxID=1354726 RepID=UPI0026475ED2|nr:ectonucleotide pyrophosphatase/phosphodiesterase [Polaribacter huanghezhanensis]WKD85879.1 Alkaline phosphatase PhoV [Polaribacter huanghezhanensis]